MAVGQSRADIADPSTVPKGERPTARVVALAAPLAVTVQGSMVYGPKTHTHRGWADVRSAGLLVWCDEDHGVAKLLAALEPAL